MICWVLLSVLLRFTYSAVDYSRYSLIRFATDEELAKWLAHIEDIGYYIDKETGDRRVFVDVWGMPSRKNPVADV
ncbi:hypothetical protein GCK32_015582, partial [Trichostrongylus colubriformis]